MFKKIQPFYTDKFFNILQDIKFSENNEKRYYIELTITNQFKLIKEIKNAVKRNCQFVIATHCYPLINEFNVISLEHNKQMKDSDFIKLVTN